jgi:hypothetical protein
MYLYWHPLRVLSMVNDAKRSDMNYISVGGGDDSGGAGLTVQGIPIVKRRTRPAGARRCAPARLANNTRRRRHRLLPWASGQEWPLGEEAGDACCELRP